MKNKWNNLSTPKKIIVAIVAFFVFMTLLGVIFPADSEDTNQTSSSQQDKDSDATTTTTSAIELTPKQKLTALINEEAGNDSNLDGINVRIKSLDIAQDQILIDLYGDENLTSGLMKSANRRLILKAIDAYQSSGLTADQVSISVWFPLVDEAGVATLRRVLSYGFSASQIARIQTANIDTKRMDSGMADVYTAIYPAFRW
jgi:hypothetical protein